MTTIGSLFSGYGGLALRVMLDRIDGRTAA